MAAAVKDKKLRARLAVAALCLSGGGALVVYFLAAVALWLSFAITLALGIFAVVVVLRSLSPEQRSSLYRSVRIGAGVGLVATFTYDVVRFLVVWVMESQLRPFDVWPLFGSLLINSPPDTTSAKIVGTLYHYANGIGFAIAYCVLLGRRGVLWGVGWALCLEAVMLTFYPGWLDIRAINEFVSMTLLGHIAYGAVLGIGCRRLLTREYSRQDSISSR